MPALRAVLSIPCQPLIPLWGENIKALAEDEKGTIKSITLEPVKRCNFRMFIHSACDNLNSKQLLLPLMGSGWAGKVSLGIAVPGASLFCAGTQAVISYTR